MDIARARDLVDRIASRSNYEFRNFEMEAQGSWHRQVRYALRQKEQLTDSIEALNAEIDRKQAELFAQQRMIAAEINQLARQRRDAEQQLQQVDSWIDSYDDAEFEDAVSGFEGSEGDNWSEVLGRVVGVELLSDKQTNKNSLMKLSLLPLSDYKKSVVITNQFANFLKKTAEQAEASLAVNRPSTMPQAAPEPRAQAQVAAETKAAAVKSAAKKTKRS